VLLLREMKGRPTFPFACCLVSNLDARSQDHVSKLTSPADEDGPGVSVAMRKNARLPDFTSSVRNG